MESVTSSQTQFEGLWMSCAATSLGSIQCSRFKTLLGLPGESTPAPGPLRTTPSSPPPPKHSPVQFLRPMKDSGAQK